MGFTTKQLAFIKARADGMGGAQAARAAGYSPIAAKVTAAKLGARTDVRDAIAKARASQAAETTPEPDFATAEQYLAAVVSGTAVPDPVRVGAARVLIAYQQRRARRPLPAVSSPREAARSDASDAERELREAWAAKVVSIRAKLQKD